MYSSKLFPQDGIGGKIIQLQVRDRQPVRTLTATIPNFYTLHTYQYLNIFRVIA